MRCCCEEERNAEEKEQDAVLHVHNLPILREGQNDGNANLMWAKVVVFIE